MATVQFLGAAGTVTGSMHLVTAGGRRVLLDAGLFQGEKALRLRNWGERVPEPRRLDAIVLSHAHIDHTGYLPVLVRQGFRGPIYCTPSTAGLLKIMLPDAAHLQEEDAERANRKGYSRHKPALPLYTIEDAHATLERLQPRPFGKPFPVVQGGGIQVHYRPAGHIIGAATVDVRGDRPEAFHLVFSGDVGRWDRPILRDPEAVPAADVLLLESTYGDRVHPPDAEEALASIVREAAQRGGAIVVPAFAVGRTQELVWMLDRLVEAKRVPALPVYVDSPSAIEVTEVYGRHPEEHDAEMTRQVRDGVDPLQDRGVHYARSHEESKALNDLRGPVIIISASGMATGGRIIHHLNHRLEDPRNTILLVGFQAAGTRGRSLKEGATKLRFFGRDVPVRAHVATLDALSAHADRDELLRWVSGFTHPPRRTYLVHGEPSASAALAEAIRGKFDWEVAIAHDRETVTL
jgi:metallo-beta-lactamase family protein